MHQGYYFIYICIKLEALSEFLNDFIPRTSEAHTEFSYAD